MSGTQEELSIFGGPPVVGAGAVQPWPQVGAADKAAVMGVLERGVLWGGGSAGSHGAAGGVGGVRGHAALPSDEQRHGGVAHGCGGCRCAAG